MIRARPCLLVLAAACAVPLAGGCTGHQLKSPATPPGQALVVLLADPESGKVGRALVSNAAGKTDLAAERDATVARSRRAPEPVKSMSEADVHRIFGEALSALPPGQRVFTLYFRFDSEALTDESQTMALEVVRAVKARPVPDILIVGHTDTMGSKASNFELGLRRATAVRTLLQQTGLEAASIDVVSHGETDLLIPTRDGVFEARNRRVDITVR